MPHRLRVKFCGVTTAVDAVTAASLGADAIGLNFYERSKRYLTPEAARPILRELPPFVEPVAIYVGRPLREVFQGLGALGRVRTFQWYISPRELHDCHPFLMIAAFPVKDRADLTEITRYLDAARAVGRSPAAVLVDAYVPGQHGGTGRTSPWPLLAEFRPPEPLILAGGLTPENVAEAIARVRPYAVDVASGVESAPGRKDAEKMRRFIGNAREAAVKLPSV